MLTLLVLWLIAVVAFMFIGRPSSRGSAGLPMAYCFGLSLIHTPGAFLYLNAEQWQSTALWTRIGFEQTVLGIYAFLAGVLLARIAYRSLKPKRNASGLSRGLSVERLSLFYIFIGLFSFFAMQILSSIPSVGSIASALGSLMIVGACLRLWDARQSGHQGRMLQTLALLPLLPLLTLVKDGFLGFGTYWLLAIASFVFNQARKRLPLFLAAPFVAFFALSVFVNYMASRTEYRQLVWYQDIGVADRIGRVVSMFENFEFLDLSNPKQRAAIDGRLNQNLLVGLAAERLDDGRVSFANGATLGEMLLGLIPRAIWPDKPAVGGGGAIVSQYTGVQFAEGTSVGAGQVLEFYINFGGWGVFAGFFIFGLVIGHLDLRVVDALRCGDQRVFLRAFLMGVAMLQPGGNLLEIVVTVASSFVAATGLAHVIQQLSFLRAQPKSRAVVQSFRMAAVPRGMKR
jgi:hypothetical protein